MEVKALRDASRRRFSPAANHFFRFSAAIRGLSDENSRTDITVSGLEQSAPEILFSLREFLCRTDGFAGYAPAASVWPLPLV